MARDRFAAIWMAGAAARGLAPPAGYAVARRDGDDVLFRRLDRGPALSPPVPPADRRDP